jgi:hypothetical protein
LNGPNYREAHTGIYYFYLAVKIIYMNDVRKLRDIETDVKLARMNKVNMKWQPYEVAIDMLVASKQITVDLEKYMNTGMETPAKRVRAISKILETIGRSFRIQSVKSMAKK